MVRNKPAANLRKKFRQMLFCCCRASQIAGGPVVHLRKKTVQLLYTIRKVPDSGNQNSMKIVFLIIAVNRRLQKMSGFICSRQFPRQTSQLRSPYSNNPLPADSRHQAGLKIPVFLILESKKSV